MLQSKSLAHAMVQKRPLPALIGGRGNVDAGQRLRVGLLGQAGAVVPGAVLRPRASDALETGLRFGDGFRGGISAFAAYAPQLADHVQLWLAGRLGFSSPVMGVTSRGRTYATVGRDFVSLGPELGIRIFDGGAGVTLWGFADLAQLGVFQAGASFSFELPTVSGAAF